MHAHTQYLLIIHVCVCAHAYVKVCAYMCVDQHAQNNTNRYVFAFACSHALLACVHLLDEKAADLSETVDTVKILDIVRHLSFVQGP